MKQSMRSQDKKQTNSSQKSDKSYRSGATISKVGAPGRHKIREEDSHNVSVNDSKMETLRKSERKETIDNKEEEEQREIAIIDKLINAKSKEINMFKNLIDNVNIESKLFDLIDASSTKMGLKNITSPREENETHRLIDVKEYAKLKKDNQELIKQKETINFQYNELVKANNKIVGELNSLTSLGEAQKKNKKESEFKIKETIKTTAIMKEANEKLKNVLLTEKTEKDNIFRALLSSITRSDEALGKEFKNIYTSFNNQDFLFKKNEEEDKIESLMGKIKFMEKEVSEKKFELNGLKKFLIGDQNKNNKIVIRTVVKKSSLIKN